jgi:uncharacterized protein (DUF58 family)
VNPWVGAVLATLAVASGWTFYRWQGVALAFTIIVFWLLLQFNRAVRVMRSAQAAPVGHVPSAVMMNAKLHEGMTMMQVVALTRSLGARQGEADDVWRWSDGDGNHVTLHFGRGKLQRWQLERPASPEP